MLLSSTSFLFAFDEVPSNYYENLGEDDSVYLFTGLGGETQRSDLITPFFVSSVGPLGQRWSPGLIRLSATRALLPSPGPDGTLGNDDDRVLVLDDLGGENRVVPVPTPGLALIGPMRLRADRALLGLGSTAPSTLAALLDIGGSNVLGPSTGPLPAFNYWYSDILPVAPDGALVADAVPNTIPEGDTAEWVSGLATSPAMEQIPVRGIGSSYFSLRSLGNGRAFKSDWVDPFVAPDGPNHILVIEGLGGLTLEAERIALRFNQEYGASLRATAHFFLPEPTDFASSDITVRIGNAWQTIPAAAIQATATGYLYEDRARQAGLPAPPRVRRLGRAHLSQGTRVPHRRGEHPARQPGALPGGPASSTAAQSLDGTKRGDRIVYRAR